MSKFIFCIFFIISSLAFAEKITLDNGNISFEAPDGLKPLSEEIKNIKYARARPPKYAIGNESATTSIAFDLKPHKIPDSQLEVLKNAFVAQFTRMNVAWKEKKIIEISGLKWIYLEFTSTGADNTKIENIMLLRGYKDQMLIFNFNAVKKDFVEYEAKFRKSINSISVKSS